MPRVVTYRELQEREKLLIETACKVIGDTGLSSFTMDRLVEAVPYSKGTVYSHFKNKEDLFVGINNDGSRKLGKILEPLSSLCCKSREKILAQCLGYYLYTRHYPVHFACEMSAYSQVVMMKASELRIRAWENLGSDSLVRIESYVADAAEQGDLVMIDKSAMRDHALTIAYLMIGTITISKLSEIGHNITLSPEKELLRSVNVLLDGFDWKPLSGEHDYTHSWERMKKEVFPSYF